MIKLMCPKCNSDKINLKGNAKSAIDTDLFQCEDCKKEFEFNDSSWEQV